MTARSRRFVLTVSLGLAAWLGEALCPRTAWANNELLMTSNNDHSVTVYPRTAAGNTPSIRTLAGAATLLANPVGVTVEPPLGQDGRRYVDSLR